MLPPAPARFSTMTCWPRLSPRNLATMRATVSVPPPGSKPTTMVIGFDGNDCARQTVQKRQLANANANRMLFPFEDWLALLHERLAAFLVILALEALFRPRLALRRVVLDLADLADDALRGAHGERRVGRDGLGVFRNSLFQVGTCNNLVHEAHFLGLGRAELARRDHDLARVGGA